MMHPPLTADENDLLEKVPAALRSGTELLRWWRRTDAEGSYASTYPETYTLNRPDDTSFGFFDTVELSTGPVKVNGNVQEMFYDEPKSKRAIGPDNAAWMAKQIREFVLHYFMRISDYRQPQRVPEQTAPAPPGLSLLSQCPENSAERIGFGFTQLFKARGGDWQRFRESRQNAIVDLRKLGTEIDYLVLQNPIFDFQFELRPFGPGGPSFALPLREFNYLVTSADFVVDEHRPEPGVRGRYGFGYAFVRKPQSSALGYGPGELEPAFELLVWTVHESGEVTVKATFVAERPTAMLRLTLDPFLWGFQLADVVGGRSIRQALQPWKAFYNSLPFSSYRIDPVFPSIRLLNALTLGQAGERLCISIEQLEKEFLFLHFQQHYQTLLGSLQTWRQIPDWLDRAALPAFVTDGRSS